MRSKSWELRAAMSVSQLRPGDTTLLGEVLARFTEGFDSPDLRDGRARLQA